MEVWSLAAFAVLAGVGVSMTANSRKRQQMKRAVHTHLTPADCLPGDVVFVGWSGMLAHRVIETIDDFPFMHAAVVQRNEPGLGCTVAEVRPGEDFRLIDLADLLRSEPDGTFVVLRMTDEARYAPERYEHLSAPQGCDLAPYQKVQFDPSGFHVVAAWWLGGRPWARGSCSSSSATDTCEAVSPQMFCAEFVTTFLKRQGIPLTCSLPSCRELYVALVETGLYHPQLRLVKTS